MDPPEITVFNSPSEIFDHDKFKIQSVYANTDPIFISNDHLTINFGETGFAKSVILNEKEIPWEVAFYSWVFFYTWFASFLYEKLWLKFENRGYNSD